MFSNPPFGVEWKKVEAAVRAEHTKRGHDGRFGPGLPRVSDGSLLFLLHLLSKMRPAQDGGSRIAIGLNGSPLFTGGAGSGESEIRTWIIEHDWLEAIVALPTDMFYNTGTVERPLYTAKGKSALSAPDREISMRPATKLLQIALRRAARGTGSSAEFLNRSRTAMIPVPDLTAILGPIRWALVGGIALRAYVPERMTLDVDIIIDADDETQARVAFVAASYRITGPLTIGGFTAYPHDGAAPVDVLTSTAWWLDDALTSPTLDPAGLPTLPRRYLLLLKLQAGRTQDLADVQRLLRGTSPEERATMRAVVQGNAAELVEDYDALVTLADLEYGS